MNQTAKVYINVLGIAVGVGLFFWVIDGYFEYIFFHQNLSFLVLKGPDTFLEWLIIRVPKHSLFVRLSFIVACVISGLIIAAFLSKRKKAEKSLKESEMKYRDLVEDINDVIFRIDQNGIIEYISPVITKIAGYDPSELIGRRFMEMVYKDDLYLLIERYNDLLSGVVKPSEYRVITKSNEPLWIRSSSKIIYDEKGVAGARGVLTLISEEKELKHQLAQMQKIEAIGTLAAGVAHEINNPINAIMNYAQLIEDKVDDGSHLAEYTFEIIHETKRVATIVRNLLTFAREENEAHSSAGLKDIIDNTMSLIQTVLKRDQITLEVDVPENLTRIKCHSQQIQQVIMNLVTNARDALNEKYPNYDENKKIIVSSNLFRKEGKDWIRTTVEDRGIGIDPGIKEKIFDPFYTTKDRAVGTGLGLSISYGIVKDHHGELSVECEPGQYTKFHMDLPGDNG